VGSWLEFFFKNWQLFTWLIIYYLTWEAKVPLDEFTIGHQSYAKWISPHFHAFMLSYIITLLSLLRSSGWSLPFRFYAKMCVFLMLLKGRESNTFHPL
jgi:hypothetical protein